MEQTKKEMKDFDAKVVIKFNLALLKRGQGLIPEAGDWAITVDVVEASISGSFEK